MNITAEEKKKILKTFTDYLKSVNGKGPKNIYIKYLEDEMHIYMQGIVSHFEQYLIKTFDQEAIDTLESFYQRDCVRSGEEFMSLLNLHLQFEFLELVTDFREDFFIYKMRLCH